MYPNQNGNLLTYLLTYSIVQNIIWKSDCHSAYQKIFCFLYGTWRFITVFTKAHLWILSWVSWIQFDASIYLNVIFPPSSRSS